MLDERNINELKEFLPFLDKLSESEMNLLLSGISEVSYSQGDNIHSPNHDCIGIVLIKSGELRTYILSENGKEVTLFRLNDGEVCVLSASCLLNNITFDTFVNAEQETEAFLISSSVFSKLQKSNLYVENFVLNITAERFSDVMWAMEQILFLSFDRRLAIFLIDETSKTGQDNLTLTHEQIAKYIGSAREVVSRMLKYFESEGFVKLHRGGIEIISKESLLRLVNPA